MSDIMTFNINNNILCNRICAYMHTAIVLSQQYVTTDISQAYIHTYQISNSVNKTANYKSLTEANDQKIRLLKVVHQIFTILSLKFP